MTATKSSAMKRMVVGAAMTLVLGGGAAVLLVPTFANAAASTSRADDPATHEKAGVAAQHTDDAVPELRHGADDAVPENAEIYLHKFLFQPKFCYSFPKV